MTARRGRSQQEHSGRDRWMVSYTDMVTILLILFIAVAAKAVQEPQTRLAESQNVLKEALEKRGIHPGVDARGLVISLPQAVLYASGDDQISPGAIPLVAVIADALRAVPNKVALIGHADTVPIHNSRFGNNWQLSAARSLRLLEVLTSRYGIPEARLSVSSYGSYNPRASNDTPEGRAENRRVEIVILNDARAN